LLKRIYFTVTNDLNFDQRMIRICRSLARAGYEVTLVGRKQKGQRPLEQEPFHQKRLRCWFSRGPLFYLEFNFRLLIHLLSRKMEGICAIDLDTILPCFLVSVLKRIPRIYDAHELFTEMKEVITRPRVKRIWLRIEKSMVPRFANGYCVSPGIAEEFRKRYGVEYEVIRNIPLLQEVPFAAPGEKIILYQGAVNEARGLEYLIPSMKSVNSRLLIYGEGNLMAGCRTLVAEQGLEGKVVLEGRVPPEDLKRITAQAYLGINLVEPYGLNQILSLSNKFFDYIHAGLPQICMNFPSYREINQKYPVAVLVDGLDSDRLAAVINNLLQNDVLYRELKANCLQARKEYNWQEEEKKLILFYKNLFG
jgi:glycosyltransferase involved in cell wall biosynthesis